MEAHEHEEAEGTRIGEVLGERWRLVERLGGGGMGEVYRAVHLALGRTVAIKVLRPEHAWNATTARRVLREGQAASRVVHPNIVRIEDVGVDAKGLPYLVQEFLDGLDLDGFALNWRGVVPARELLPLMIPTLDALGALHDAGILHRDLKPGNVFVVKDGARWSPRLLDFGLASINDDLDGQARITSSKVTLGSPAYMSPEQFRDPRSLTPRSDLWSFGVMLYELLSGV
ncbi:MAG: serine/threonine protein kinase, partial [Deltaproteobacteria bacterium]|nr:serine/threonine protein kinase [Deltaproteobacteria bacterium]